MANNCLVTKLKGVVDNPNLPKLGEITFKVLKGKQRELRISVSETITATITDGVIKPTIDAATGETTVSITPGEVNILFLFPNEGKEATVKLSNKYAIIKWEFPFVIPSEMSHIDAIEFDANQLAYSPLKGQISFMESRYTTGDIKEILKNQNGVNYFDIFMTSITGTTEDIANAIPSGLQRVSAGQSGLTGNIRDLAKYPSLFEVFGGSGVSGTVEEFGPLFLAACNEAGVASANVHLSQMPVTYQGETFIGRVVVANGNWSVTYDS